MLLFLYVKGLFALSDVAQPQVTDDSEFTRDLLPPYDGGRDSPPYKGPLHHGKRQVTDDFTSDENDK